MPIIVASASTYPSRHFSSGIASKFIPQIPAIAVGTAMIAPGREALRVLVLLRRDERQVGFERHR